MLGMNKVKLSVGIIDLKINNIFSVYRACLEAGFKTEIIELKKASYNYDIIILPGVGAFKSGIDFLKKNNIHYKLYDYLAKPNSFIYGICLGMQLLFDKSNEFIKTDGLKLIEGKVTKFNRVKTNLTHLGWNKFKIQEKNLKTNFKRFENNFFYFVHSYYAVPNDKKNIFASTKYGNVDFCSIVKKSNILGTQFHPEKSGLIGVEFLKNLKKLKT